MTAETSSLSARLAERAARHGIDLTDPQLVRIEQYLTLLARWNASINLTALPLDGFPDASLDRLVVEPLIAAKYIPDRHDGRWLDLGSGGGSPAIPLKIIRPSLDLTMVESRSRKGAFLREAVRTLGLTRASVLTERFEALEPLGFSTTARVVTIRAVRMDEDVLLLALRLLTAGGKLLLFAADSILRAIPGLAELEPTALPAHGAVLRVFEKREHG